MRAELIETPVIAKQLANGIPLFLANALGTAPCYERVVDVVEELVKFTLPTRDCAGYLVDRYSERSETAEMLATTDIAALVLGLALGQLSLQ